MPLTKKTGKLLPEALSYSDMSFINIKPYLVGLQVQAFEKASKLLPCLTHEKASYNLE